MNDWRQTLQLCQVTLWVMVQEADPKLLNGRWERARSIQERLEAPELSEDDDEFDEADHLLDEADESDDFEDSETDEPEFEYLDIGAPWREQESDEDSPEDEPEILVAPEGATKSLLEAMGVSVAELVEASHCFENDAMGFSFLLQMEDLCDFFMDLVGEDEVESFVTNYLELNADGLEVSDLLKAWKGFKELCFRLHEEAAFQWLLAGDLLANVITVDDPTIPSPQVVRQAIGEVIDSRNNGRVDLSAKFKSALAVLQPRVLEIARTSNPDSDQVVELFDQCGGTLNCNLAASKLPAAVNNYLQLVAEEH